MNEFDLLKSPLTGTNLIEASAGTGKTYAITGIYLRLVLEQGLGVERILVVTFTRDATAELRDRTRKALKSLLAEIESPGGAGGEELLQKLAAGYRDSGRRELALGRLSGALRTFDQAAISTIHGFCGRMLQENAFESAVPFDTELITDQSRLVREVVEDFWRRNFYGMPPEVVQCAQQEIKSPGYFLGLARSHPSPARLNIVPQAAPLPPAELEKLLSGFRKTYHELRRAWPAAAEEVQGLLAGSGLNARSYGGKVPALVKEMDDYLAPAEPALPLDFGNIARFTPEGLEDAVTKQGTVPQHRIFDLCSSLSRSAGEVSRAAGQHFLFLKTDLFRFLREELPLRKQQRNVQFYDDLLLGMLEAVRGETSRALVRTLREKYRAVLIDEFQDTDPVQYAVFSRVFAGGNSSLFLIGDPKQAIYGFRGADIFTYREAARQVERVYTLGRNWRSEPGLVESVNAIFSGVELPFVFDWIGFRPAEPARATGSGELRLDGCSQAPFQLWLMDTGSLPDSLLTRGGFIRKGDARELACRAVAAEIARLVSLGREGRAMLGGEPLKPGDIAVLVRRNTEAEQVRQALARLNIPSLLHEREYLFDTHEAREMERVLAAVAEPVDEYLLRAALATDILGLDGESLAGLQEHESGLERWMNRFGQYNLTWQDHGFIRLFAELISAEKVRERLLGFADGERRLTNLVQLAEVLQRHSLESKPGIRGLVKWLSEQRDPDSPRPEELKVRLETDEDAVRVATVHKSKGLEYPVVFCPMAWDGSTGGRREQPLRFHDSRGHLTLDLGSADREQNRRLAETESLAEDLRLLYVALTRARSRCYMVWGRINESWSSAPAYLFHRPGPAEPAAAVKNLSSEQLRSDLQRLADSAGGSIALSPMPPGAGEPCPPLPDAGRRLACRRFAGRIDRSWKISSFSALVSGKARETELPDRDAQAAGLEEPAPGREEPRGIFAFPRGTKAGNFFHGMLERLDFTGTDPVELEGRVDEELRLYGFESSWKKEVCGLLQRLFSAELGRDREKFTLGRVGLHERLSELEFYLPLDPLTPEKLREVFAAFGRGPVAESFPEKIGRLEFSPVRGFLKGFIDLVLRHGRRFYLVDWKSNYLGAGVGDYRPEALAAVMQSELYTLQYHLYTVALDRYLRYRVPDYSYDLNFGGVYYIFLRGVDPSRGPHYGLYYDLPPAVLVGELGRVLVSQQKDG